MPPYGFSWVIPQQLAALARPSSVDDLHWLRQNGIDVILSAMEDPLPRLWINDAGLMAVHVPIVDMEAPTNEQFDAAVDAIVNARTHEMAIAVHCLAGRGRTGTILAGYLVHTGLPAAEAMARIRALRPGSIETPDQERAIEAFARRRR